MSNEQKPLTAGELIAKLRKFMPSTLVIVDGIHDFNAVYDLSAVTVWRLDNPVVDTYTTNMVKGLDSQRRGEGRSAVYLNSGFNRVTR